VSSDSICGMQLLVTGFTGSWWTNNMFLFWMTQQLYLLLLVVV